jgi:hypothetical protein
MRVGRLSGRLSRAYAVGRAGLSLTTQRLKATEMLRAEPLRKIEGMQARPES